MLAFKSCWCWCCGCCGCFPGLIPCSSNSSRRFIISCHIVSSASETAAPFLSARSGTLLPRMSPFALGEIDLDFDPAVSAPSARYCRPGLGDVTDSAVRCSRDDRTTRGRGGEPISRALLGGADLPGLPCKSASDDSTPSNPASTWSANASCFTCWASTLHSSSAIAAAWFAEGFWRSSA